MRIAISIQALEHADPSIPTLSIGHVMLALDAGVAFMSEIRSFYITRIDVSIFEKPIGVLWIRTRRWLPDGAIANQPAQLISNSSIKDDRFNATGDDVPDSGVYTDTGTPGMELHYTFNPRKVKSEDIFTCLMEAFLILTYEGYTMGFNHLDAVSAPLPPRLALNIHKSDRYVPRNDVIGNLLWLIMQFYATQKRFNEIDFVMIINAPGHAPMDWAAGFFMRLHGSAGVATT